MHKPCIGYSCARPLCCLLCRVSGLALSSGALIIQVLLVQIIQLDYTQIFFSCDHFRDPHEGCCRPAKSDDEIIIDLNQLQ